MIESCRDNFFVSMEWSKSMNKFIATGQLLKIIEGKRNDVHLLVLIKRPNQPNAKISFLIKSDLDPSIKINDTITLEGAIRGFNQKNENGKWKINHYLEAETVKLAQNEIQQEYNLPGHYFPQHSFIGYGEGKISSIADFDTNRKTLIVAIYGEKEIPDMATLIVRDNFRTHDEYNSLHKGATIAFIINVQTQKKEVNEKQQSYTDFLVRDFSIINKRFEISNPDTEE